MCFVRFAFFSKCKTSTLSGHNFVHLPHGWVVVPLPIGCLDWFRRCSYGLWLMLHLMFWRLFVLVDLCGHCIIVIVILCNLIIGCDLSYMFIEKLHVGRAMQSYVWMFFISFWMMLVNAYWSGNYVVSFQSFYDESLFVFGFLWSLTYDAYVEFMVLWKLFLKLILRW